MAVLFRRIIITLIIVFVLLLLFIYWVIPAQLTIDSSIAVNCNTAAASRVINNNWKNMFYRHSDTAFYIDDYSYSIQVPLYNGSRIRISKGAEIYQTTLFVIPVSADSSLLHWNASATTAGNPVSKAFTYFRMKALQSNMQKVMKQFGAFLEKPGNVYQYNIVHTTLTDTVLMFTKQKSVTYPATSDIYVLVDKLKKYIADKGATETNSPMLNIVEIDSGYVTMVGIPVNKELPPYNNIVPRYLHPIKDKMLTTEVHGGPAAIQNAYRQIKQYMQDHSFSPPVIPFELMITDRRMQKDTAKWVTKIFYPII